LFSVKRLIKKTDMRNPDPGNKRYSSLAWAAVLGHEETFDFLLSSGHDDREYSKDSENNTILILLADTRPPLSEAYSSGPSDNEFLNTTLRMARSYVDRYPITLDWANIEGKTALHVAAMKGNEELVQMLCDLGADVDLADNDGNTPLHYASAWGHITIVQLLIERGRQYNLRNNEGFTPADYAYSLNTKEVLEDTVRSQFEINKRTRRGVFQQAAQRGTEWSAAASHLPPPPRMYTSNSGSNRMRSGSGTSRTTTTSDSGDFFETQSSSRSHPALSSSLSPARRTMALPSAHSPSPMSANSSIHPSYAAGVAAASSQSHSSLAPPALSNPASALSPIANRMRERDADAIEKYKLRQRSGSGTTASAASESTSGTGSALPSASMGTDDELTALHTLVTGSVAPRRRLRPSASAAQLRSNTLVAGPNQNGHDVLRHRSGTSPVANQFPSPATSPLSENSVLSTPMQVGPGRVTVKRSGSTHETSKERPLREKFMGPSMDYARFPPPPAKEPPEKTAAPTTTPTTQTRRLPFNLLSSHMFGGDHGSAAHKRNASASAAKAT